MKQTNINQLNEVFFKKTEVKKTLPEKTAKGKKNLSKIVINEKYFQHLSKRS